MAPIESPQRRDVGSISSARTCESQQRLVRDRCRRDVAGRGVASGGGDMKSDGGGSSSGSGSGGALGKNASVPDTCQMCLSMSSSNECQAKGKICNATRNARSSMTASTSARTSTRPASRTAVMPRRKTRSTSGTVGRDARAARARRNATRPSATSEAEVAQCVPDDSQCSTTRSVLYVLRERR